MTEERKVSGSFYVQLKPTRWSGRIDGLKAATITQSKPTVARDAVAIKVNVSVPVAIFDRLPEVTIDVPLSHIGLPDIDSDPYPIADDANEVDE
jgi:hypothetical protein